MGANPNHDADQGYARPQPEYRGPIEQAKQADTCAARGLRLLSCRAGARLSLARRIFLRIARLAFRC